MTEEQKAEEYAKNIFKDVTCNIGHPRARQINSIDIQDAWLDGYHEYQKEHEWHDLEKDPTDEPKKDGEYLVQVMCIMFNDIEYCVGKYWKEENRWEGEQLRGLLVTKWKEIE